MSADKLYTVEEAAVYLKRSPAGLYVQMSRGLLAPSGYVQGGGNRQIIAFSQADLDAFRDRKANRAKREEDASQPPRTCFHAARRAAGIDRKEAADRLGAALRAVYRWEYGEIEPNIATIRAMAAAYGCTVAEVMGEHGPGAKLTTERLRHLALVAYHAEAITGGLVAELLGLPERADADEAYAQWMRDKRHLALAPWLVEAWRVRPDDPEPGRLTPHDRAWWPKGRVPGEDGRKVATPYTGEGPTA